MIDLEFEPFGKIPRLSRECTITEKIDGTNAAIWIGEDGEFRTASRTRWVTWADDNYGFARWAQDHRDELLALGPGYHFGEWYGAGIQKRYSGLIAEKRFALFNTTRWADERPSCCDLVPVLYAGVFTTEAVDVAIADLRSGGSRAVPGCMRPEGVIVYHLAARALFKKTLEKDEIFKGIAA